MSRKGILVVTLLFGVAFALLAFATRGYREVEAMQSMEKAMAAVRREFPEVKPISPGTLAHLMESPSMAIAVVDAREPEEFGVSHLPEAVNVRESNAFFPSLSDPPPSNQLLVFYDTVGFRSAKLAKALIDGGVGEVTYLEGGIFQWANEGRLLVNAEGKSTTKVHPYNKLWGRLLETR